MSNSTHPRPILRDTFAVEHLGKVTVETAPSEYGPDYTTFVLLSRYVGRLPVDTTTVAHFVSTEPEATHAHYCELANVLPVVQAVAERLPAPVAEPIRVWLNGVRQPDMVA